MIVLKETDILASDAQAVASVFQDLLAGEDALDRDKEHFYVMHLDSRNTVKLVELVSIGSSNASVVHPRETFRRAVMAGSVSIIIAHNHPSADVTPSAQDVALTRRLFEAGQILDIRLLDHIIFSPDTYCSMKGEGGW
jgi:DNA repair protein RadC